MSVYVIVTSAS